MGGTISQPKISLQEFQSAWRLLDEAPCLNHKHTVYSNTSLRCQLIMHYKGTEAAEDFMRENIGFEYFRKHLVLKAYKTGDFATVRRLSEEVLADEDLCRYDRDYWQAWLYRIGN